MLEWVPCWLCQFYNWTAAGAHLIECFVSMPNKGAGWPCCPWGCRGCWLSYSESRGGVGASFELSFFNGLRRLCFFRNAAPHLGFYGESFQQLAYDTLADWPEPQPRPNKTREGSGVYTELPSLTLNASSVTRHW